MKNNANEVDTGFRFPERIYAKVYAINPDKGIIVKLRLLREDGNTTVQINILHELDSGLSELVARRYIPCTVNDDCIVSFDERFNKPIKYRSVDARFITDEHGRIWLQITHIEDGETIVDNFKN